MNEYKTLSMNFNILRKLQFEEKHPALAGVDLFAGVSAFHCYRKLLALLQLYDTNSVCYPGFYKDG